MDNKIVYNSEDIVWYFAFGSNMKSSVMKSRNINILSITPVVVHQYVLTFDVFGLPYSEPSMASIAKYLADDETSETGSNPPDVHGVAYLISRSDFRRLVGSEGGGVAYDEIEVTGSPVDHGNDLEPLAMVTLTAKHPRRPNVSPSRRYLTLLREGAEEHNLPAEYRKYLEDLPEFSAGGARLKQLGATSFLWVGRRIVRSLATRVRSRTDSNGQCPSWYSTLVYYVYSSMWLWHDYIHAPIFGSGQGKRIQYGNRKFLV
ncbi:gliotoxin biosynthesis protein [Xylariales sp. AK1849]|nr:gliotoxin biosynthesis protein [Xylariales sp. AK1849]